MIILAFMVVLAALMMLHQRSRAENVVSPIEVLLGTPPGPAGEIQAITEGPVTVYLPPDATSEPGSISISLAAPGLALVEDNSGWTRTQVVNVEFLNSSGVPVPGISFNEPVEVCFNLTEQEWQAFMAQTDAYQVQHYDEQASPPAWALLPEKTYPARRQYCGQTTHLSLFALATDLEQPVSAPTGINPGFGTIVPTRTPVPSTPTRNQNRDGASSEGGLSGGPTGLPATRIPPTATSIPPTPIPPTATQLPSPTPIPPTDVPTELPTDLPTEPMPSDVPTQDAGLPGIGDIIETLLP